MSRQVIVITGGNSGIGLATARAFLAGNSQNSIWLGVRKQRAGADELARQFPQTCRCVLLDVTSAEAWKKTIGETLALEGRVDVLVNNAGAHRDMLLGLMPANAWNETLATNLTGVFHGSQAVLPAMISQKSGRIINIASLSALLPPPGQTNYAAAKAGVVALTQSLAKEVARLGITVNALCPGYIDTESLAHWSAEERQQIQARIPMRRLGRPEEVAAAVRFLACAEASYITGSVLKIDGGFL
ncbi:MAG TPA: 3-oxoacyl-ACP reductase FabG [Candidatus Dormibacteraeota bacterium]|nr:3-oxoacyl-ACP reductase FabG [Candidatus Dormibacteraeota bacterium]